MPVRSYLELAPGKITRDAARTLMHRVLTDREVTDAQIGDLLTRLTARPVTSEELAGFAEAMRALSVELPFTDAERATLVDTCGTGGDNSGSFNISTGAALVAAAAGARIAKHGNRSITSRCGSADVLEALGVPVALSPRQSVECLRSTGFTFLYAPALHPALSRVQSIRRALGFRTVFNLLGPLTNPARAQAQVMGVYSPELVYPVAEALARLGIRRAIVVHGSHPGGGLDELSTVGDSSVAELNEGVIAEGVLHASDYGLPPAPLEALTGGDAQQNAAILRSVFAAAPGPHRDIVIYNAAAALLAGGLASTLREGVEKAAAAIDGGSAAILLDRLAQFRTLLTSTES